MWKSFLTAVVFIVFLTQIVTSVDYCNMKSCSGLQHIGCKNNGNFGGSCPSDARVVKMGPYRNMILKSFNRVRNAVAGGCVKPLPKAARMATMRWCWELEQLAKMNVMRCKAEYDKCRNTKYFSFAGQDIGLMTYKGKESKYNDCELIEGRIREWIAQIKNIDPEQIRKFPSNNPSSPIGSFTIAVTDKCTHIGCSAIRFINDSKQIFILVCNFSNINMPGRSVYETSETTASGCKHRGGRNSDYPNLCNPLEVYDNTKENGRRKRETFFVYS